MQSLIVILIVVLAAFYTGLRIWRSLRGGKATGCGCDCQCDTASGKEKQNCSIQFNRVPHAEGPTPDK